jgi:TonB family protein
MGTKSRRFGYNQEQRYGLLASLSFHSLICTLFFGLSFVNSNNDIKTFYIQFTQLGEQTAPSHPLIGDTKRPKVNKPPGDEIKEKTSVIKETPLKEHETVKEVSLPPPLPEHVREMEKPKFSEPEMKVIKEEIPVIKAPPIKEREAVIRNAAIQNHEAVKTASAPAPKPQSTHHQSGEVLRSTPTGTSVNPNSQPQKTQYQTIDLANGNLSYTASSGKPTVIETEFGSGGAPGFLDRHMPVYPKMAKKLGMQGKVVLRLFINDKGRLLNVEVVEPAGFGFTESAIKAVKMSSFSPAHEKGVSVASKALLTIQFVLKKN